MTEQQLGKSQAQTVTMDIIKTIYICRLPALIGLSRAMDLILTGRLLEPKEAYDWGLANRVVTTGTAFGQALNLAKEIVKFPQECLKVDRESTLFATFRLVLLCLLT